MNAMDFRGQRIRRLSHALRILCWFALTLILAGGCLWLIEADPRGFKIGTHLIGPDVNYDISGRLWILLSILRPAVLLFLFQRLMGFFAKGMIFVEQTVRCMRSLAWGMIFLWFAPIALAYIQIQVQPGNTVVRISLDGYLFGGVLTLLIAWIIDEGRKLQEEQSLVV